MKFIATTSEKLNTLPIVSGQMIFSTDDRVIYLDVEDKRTSYQSIITLLTEENRKTMVFPVKGFYYIEETQILWRYDDTGWIQLTKNAGDNVIFVDRNGMPENGEENKIYVNSNDDTIYRWNEEKKEFVPMCQTHWNDMN